MRKTLLFISILCFSGILTAQIDYNKSVGSTAGSFEVNLSGAATYQIPIYAPPGTQGAQPNISLVYNSQAGMGPLGVSWNIAGLSAITRVQKNFYHDGQVAPLSWTNDDHYALDGQILIPISGSNGSNGTEYRTENDGFAKIFSYGNVGGVPERFEVFTKDGKKIEYGASYDSRYAPPELVQPLVWGINKITDENGNYMTFEYINNTQTSLPNNMFKGDFLISKIKYTGNASLQPYNSIEFVYDACSIYQPYNLGNKMLKNTLSLKQITSYAEGTIARQYRLSYKPNTLNTCFFMQNVIEDNGTGESYDTTKFVWEKEEILSLQYNGNASDQFSLNRKFMSNDPLEGTVRYERLIGDFNGDGMIGIVLIAEESRKSGNTYVTTYRSKISLSIGTIPISFASSPFYLPASSENLPIRDIAVFDINGDGKDELVYINGQKGIYVVSFNSSTNKFNAPVKWFDAFETSSGQTFRYAPRGFTGGNTDGIVTFGDIGGDGLPDLIIFTTTDIKVYKNLLSSFNNECQNTSTGLTLSSYKHRKMVADVNGDGLADAVIFAEDGVKILLSSGNKFEGSVSGVANYCWAQGWRTEKHDIQLVDVNRDGRADIVAFKDNRAYVSLSTGNSFMGVDSSWSNTVTFDTTYTNNYQRTPCTFVDVNGDGLPDIVTTYGKDVKLYLNTGKSFIFQSNFGVGLLEIGNMNTIDTPIRWGDFDGDGVVDMISFGMASCPIYKGKGNGYQYRVITTFADAMKNKTQATYGSHNQAYENRTSAETYPYSGKIAPSRLVDKVTVTADSIGKIKEENYTFSEPLFHFKGKGFLGFTKIWKNDLLNGGYSTQTFALYNANNCINLLPQVQENVLPTNEKITNTQSCTTIVNANKRLVVKLTSEVIKSELDGVQTSKDYQYDDVLNPIEVYTKVYPLNTSNLFYSEKVNTVYENRGTWNFKPTRITATKTKDGETVVNTTSFTYTGVRPASKTTEPDQPDYKVVESYSNYDAYGNPGAVTLSAQGLTSRAAQYVYDNKGRFVTKITNPLNHTEQYTYEPKYGNILKYWDVNNFETQYTYNAWGQRIKSTSPNGNIAWSSIKWVPQNCKIPKAVYYTLDTASGQMPSYTFYDGLGREVCHYTYTDFTSAYNIYTDTRYDNKGRISKKSLPYNSINTTDDSKQWIVYEYDNLGRLKKETGPYLNKSYAYGLRTVTETDHLNNNATVTKEYDLLGNLTKTTDVGGSIVYTYNAQGLPVKVVAAGQTTTMAYDLMGRRIRITDPNAGTDSSQYNRYGELIRKKDANGNFITYTYDGLGRMKTKYVNGNATAEGSAVYNYDSGTKAIGKLSSVIAPNHETYYAYDASKGFLSVQKEKIFGTEYSTNYAYNNLGQVSRVTYPSGYYTDMLYTSGRLRRVLNPQGLNIYVTSNINPMGQPIKEYYGSILCTRMGYNAAGMLTSMSTGKQSDPLYPPVFLMSMGSAVAGVSDRQAELPFTYFYDSYVQNLNYTYNDRGMMLSRACNNSGQREFFSYDKLARLTKAENTKHYDPKGENTFEYNNMGNILYKSDVGSMQYSTLKPHAVTTLKFEGRPLTPPYNYLKTDYTPFNKISSAANQTLEGQWYDSYEFKYGNDQQRIRMELKQKQPEASTSKTLRTYTYINGLYEEEKNNQTGKTRMLHYIKANGKTVAIYVKESLPSGQVGEAMYYIHTDHLGSYDVITDANGNIVEKLSFDAWGNRRKPGAWEEFDTDTSLSAHLFRRGFTGHEHLDKIGVINMNGRLYDPALGRFFSPDPYVSSSTNTQAFNRYSYCLNNPLMYTDPSGEFIFSYTFNFLKGLFRSPFKEGWNAVKNEAKIWAGLFVSDPNKNTGQQIWQVVSRFIWETPQTLIGFTYSYWLNNVGQVTNVSYWGGATVITSPSLGDYEGSTNGSFIVGGRSIKADPNNPLFQHEYGHYLQSQASGWGNLPRYGIPSYLGLKGNNNHRHQIYEQDANLRSFNYFNKYVDGFYQTKEQYEYNQKYGIQKGWDFNEHPLIGDPNNTHRYYDYYSSTDRALLSNLSLSAKWYDITFSMMFPVFGPFIIGIMNHAYNNTHRPGY